MRRRMFWNNTSAYKDGYLTFIALEDGTFSYSTASQYTIDDGKHWIDLPANTATPTIQAGKMISWRCENYSTNKFTSSNKFNAEGNVLSMKFGENFKQGNNRTCSSMFDGCSGLVSAENLIIPRNIVNNAYMYFFRNCTSLGKAPNLPATSVAAYGYSFMFYGCTSLTSAPELPATTLANSCYYAMFAGCTSLTSAPALPATTLADSCYRSMFSNCTSLEKAPTILPATTLANSCYLSMFYNCTSLTSAPELPATTLADACYMYMFQVCTSLTYIKCLATNISANQCTTYWMVYIPSTGTFVKASGMAGWTRGPHGIPTGWTIEEE